MTWHCNFRLIFLKSTTDTMRDRKLEIWRLSGNRKNRAILKGFHMTCDELFSQEVVSRRHAQCSSLQAFGRDSRGLGLIHVTKYTALKKQLCPKPWNLNFFSWSPSIEQRHAQIKSLEADGVSVASMVDALACRTDVIRTDAIEASNSLTMPLFSSSYLCHCMSMLTIYVDID